MKTVSEQLLQLTVRTQTLELFVVELAQQIPDWDALFQRLAEQLQRSESMLAPEIEQEINRLRERMQLR